VLAEALVIGRILYATALNLVSDSSRKWPADGLDDSTVK
jgi:hypothetical protein